jgi:glycosyltransferase involved in cell wall biosynthesis
MSPCAARPRVLFATVDPALEGGVASYVRAVRAGFTVPVRYLYVGSRPGTHSKREAVVRLLRDYWRFWRAVRTGGFSVVHVNPSLEGKALVRDGLLVIIARLAGVPTVVLFHGWVPSCERALRLPGIAWLFRATFLRADHILVLAQSFATRLRSMGAHGPISVTCTAVEDPIFAAPVRAGRSGPVNILFLARLELAKGVLTAVDVLVHLRSRGHEVRLLIAGDGPAMDQVRGRIRDLPDTDVELLGYVRGEAKISALNAADLYLFPTDYGEGMPISVLEAMAAGLPVVTRPVGGVADFFIDGVMGYVTDAVDPAVFADLAERLCSDSGLRATIGAYNKEYARRNFTGLASAERLEAIYSALHAPPALRAGRRDRPTRRIDRRVIEPPWTVPESPEDSCRHWRMATRPRASPHTKRPRLASGLRALRRSTGYSHEWWRR